MTKLIKRRAVMTASSSPQTLEVQVDGIPSELKALPQWVCWRWEERGDNWTKPPFQPSGVYAASTDSTTWSTFEDVRAAYRNGGFAGIGFVLAKGDGIIGIDLDHCVDPQTGEIESWAWEIVNEMNSYTERSPSGTGLRILARGKLPGTGHKRGNIEVYDRGRYLTVTGQVVPEGCHAN